MLSWWCTPVHVVLVDVTTATLLYALQPFQVTFTLRFSSGKKTITRSFASGILMLPVHANV